MATLGFLGLGVMGSGMAANLVDAGHDVLVWNRTPTAIEPLVARGARRAESAAEALGAGISFSMLANDTAVDDVLTEQALEPGRGGVHVCMASISPAAGDRLAARCFDAGVAYAAAPVLGRPPVAAAGQLNIIFAGPTSVLERVQPYFDAMGKHTWVLGDVPRMANVVKASVNYNIIHAIQALGESIAIVERHGVAPQMFVDLLTGTLFGGVVYEGYGGSIADRCYTPPAFAMALGAKDLGLAEAAAAEVGVALPRAPVLRALFDAALADPDLRDLDWAALAEVTRTRAE